MSEMLPPPSLAGNHRIVPVSGHPDYAVTDDGTFWTCREPKGGRKSDRAESPQEDSDWRHLEVNSSPRRSYPWVRMSGTSYNAAHLVLDAFSRERPNSQYEIQYADGDMENLALSNLSWVKKEESPPEPAHARSHKYVADHNMDWRIRTCLTCYQKFESWGPGNRRCARCDDKLKSPAYRSARGEPAKIRM